MSVDVLIPWLFGLGFVVLLAYGIELLHRRFTKRPSTNPWWKRYLPVFMLIVYTDGLEWWHYGKPGGGPFWAMLLLFVLTAVFAQLFTRCGAALGGLSPSGTNFDMEG